VIGIIESLLDAASGEEVLKGRSFLAGKKDSLIGSDKLYMAEENRVPNSPYNREFDDELTPTKRKMIVERGVLKSFLHNIYSAEKLGEDRTGNGFLGGGGISTGFTNIKVYGEKFRKGDLLSKVKHGVYMLSTGDRANESTGDLSAMVTGYYVKDGKIVHPLKETMIGINLIELLSNVSAIGEDFFMAGGINTPSLLVDNVKISGRA
jgi:PmbA protein